MPPLKQLSAIFLIQRKTRDETHNMFSISCQETILQLKGENTITETMRVKNGEWSLSLENAIYIQFKNKCSCAEVFKSREHSVRKYKIAIFRFIMLNN